MRFLYSLADYIKYVMAILMASYITTITQRIIAQSL